MFQREEVEEHRGGEEDEEQKNVLGARWNSLDTAKPAATERILRPPPDVLQRTGPVPHGLDCLGEIGRREAMPISHNEVLRLTVKRFLSLATPTLLFFQSTFALHAITSVCHHERTGGVHQPHSFCFSSTRTLQRRLGASTTSVAVVEGERRSARLAGDHLLRPAFEQLENELLR